MPLRVRNWDRYQHYRDRNPPWIKLHVALLDDYEFASLTTREALAVVKFWMLAARTGNWITASNDWIRTRIDVTDQEIDHLIGCGWLERCDESDRPAVNPWTSRYITKETRELVWARDGGRCVSCGAKRELEYDHVIPVSRGGTSDAENIQLLCRSCNRSKHNKLESAEQTAPQADAATAEQLAPPSRRSRASVSASVSGTEVGVGNSVKRLEAEKLPPVTAPLAPDDFDRSWSAYPKRLGGNNKADARGQWNARIKQGESAVAMHAGTLRYAAFISASNTEPQYVMQAARFYGRNRHYAESWDGGGPVEPELEIEG